MNKQITELFHQSREVYRVDIPLTRMFTVEYNPTKFAELIIRECMRVADSRGKGWAHLNGTSGNRIRQHFGVEE